MNTLKTIFLMGILSSLMIIVGNYFGGKSGLILAFLFAIATNIFAYWFSAPMALSMSRAQPIAREQAPELYRIVEHLAQQAQIPVPTVYFIPSDSPNAFATGRDPQHSSIAVTRGILNLLTSEELEAVLAHELGHVKNRDILISTIAAVFAGVVTTLAHWGMYMGTGSYDDRDSRPNPIFLLLMMIAAPIAASLINLAISRSREYEADATGAKICGHPMALASALAKIEALAEQIPMTSANPAISSLYIVKPQAGSWLINLMSTHPPIPDRIKRLEEMNYLLDKN
ncbi:MAG: zinc metalloprotease HtpX [Cyanobacteria bacterium SZAS LIN-2]|nr:zinc metalloprotease HtpX [Cyanobacteria bacterium SZAS LIN-2]MBS2006434.1 zinc metalloprotease HtpX [Cyanobacteria bacterium SZAS TMP-1]